ncbi:MAG: right-handed parallel beta-helix repeat-containing protein, partial [Actinobacteria bacterium]|nr:right-handed parallel beta-helix repeat-containing protein [Actinomycetota bacterium]
MPGIEERKHLQTRLTGGRKGKRIKNDGSLIGRSISILVVALFAMAQMNLPWGVVPLQIAKAAGADYYVAKTGSDSNIGSAVSPFLTIGKAASMARAGDTVYVRAGVYNESITMQNSGTSGGYITIRNYFGETPVLDGNNRALSYAFSFNGKSYVKLQGFEIRNYNGTAVRNDSSAGTQQYDQVIDSIIHDNGYWSANRTVAADGIRVQNSYAMLIQGNTIYRNNRAGIEERGGTRAGGGRAGYTTIRENTFRNPGEDNIFTYNSYGNVIEHNRFENQDSYNSALHNDNIQVAWVPTAGSDTATTIRNNYLYTTTTSGNQLISEGGRGLKIYGNVIVGGHSTSINLGSAPNSQIYNNTLVYSRYQSIYIHKHSNHPEGSTGVKVYNNLVYQAGASSGEALEVDSYSQSGFSSDYNIYHRNSGSSAVVQWGTSTYALSSFASKTGNDAHSLSNPSSINLNPNDEYRLGAGSVAINRGTNSPSGIVLPSTDRDGNARIANGLIDIGAYEYGASTLPASDGGTTVPQDTVVPQPPPSSTPALSFINAVINDPSGDGKSDAVAFYDYGGFTAGAWVFKTASALNPLALTFAPAIWWKSASGAFDLTKVKVVTGDFDGNGRTDAMALYNYGGSNSSLILFESNGGSYDPPTQVFSSPNWNWNNTKLVSGDFNGDGKDELFAFYTYGGTQTGVFVFEQNA